MTNTWKQLYPDGHAFNTSDNTNRAKIHNSINVIFGDYLEQLQSLVNGAIASDSIDESEISFLENRYGVYYVDGLTLSERLERVRQRITYPNGVVNRSSAAWIEYVLQSFGFDVNVSENTGLSPELLSLFSKKQYGNSLYGSANYGGFQYDIIANSMFNGEKYNFGGKLWSTFFIHLTTPIPTNRIQEFRELVLKLKPAHLVAVLFEGEGIGDFNNDFNNDYSIGNE